MFLFIDTSKVQDEEIHSVLFFATLEIGFRTNSRVFKQPPEDLRFLQLLSFNNTIVAKNAIR